MEWNICINIWNMEGVISHTCLTLSQSVMFCSIWEENNRLEPRQAPDCCVAVRNKRHIHMLCLSCHCYVYNIPIQSMHQEFSSVIFVTHTKHFRAWLEQHRCHSRSHRAAPAQNLARGSTSASIWRLRGQICRNRGAAICRADVGSFSITLPVILLMQSSSLRCRAAPSEWELNVRPH